MKTKLMLLLLVFSLSLNAAALAAYLLSRPSRNCPAQNLMSELEEKLNLTHDQQQGFARQNEIYRQHQHAVAQRVCLLRRELLVQALDESQELAGLDGVLYKIGEEQLELQRRLLENLRAKLLLLDPQQRQLYRQHLLNMAGGCGCVGCTGPCH